MDKCDRALDAFFGFVAVCYIGLLKFVFWLVVIPIGVYDGTIVMHDRKTDGMATFFALLVFLGLFGHSASHGSWPTAFYMPTIMYFVMGGMFWSAILERASSQKKGMQHESS